MANFSTKIASTVTASALVASAMGTSVVSAASEFLPYAELLATNKVIGTQATEAGYRLNDQITRAELAKVAANLGGYTAVKCTGTVFADVTVSLGDLCDAIETLAAANVVSKANTTFRPTANVTRAEMTKMLLGATAKGTTDTSAGYSDVTSSLGDLAGYINKAAELGIVNKATYFRPNANASRGEAFKIAANAAGLKLDTKKEETTGNTVAAGNLTITTTAQPVAQEVPQNVASHKVATVKVAATGGDVVLSSLTINRSGLGTVNGLITSVAHNGVEVSNATSFNNTTQNAHVVLTNPITIKSGTSVELDVLVSLPDLESQYNENGRHTFTLVSANDTNLATPVTLGLFASTTYKVATMMVNDVKGYTAVKAGQKNANLLEVSISAPADREVSLKGFTLSKKSGPNLAEAVANLKVLVDGKDTGAKVVVTADKIIVNGLNQDLTYSQTAKFQIAGDVIYMGKDSSNAMSLAEFAFNIANSSDIRGVEKATGYNVRVANHGSNKEGIIKVQGVDVTITPDKVATKALIAGEDVTLIDGTLTSPVAFNLRQFEIFPQFVMSAGAQAPKELSEVFESLYLNVGGVQYPIVVPSYGNSSNGASLIDDISASSIRFADAATNNGQTGTGLLYLKDRGNKPNTTNGLHSISANTPFTVTLKGKVKDDINAISKISELQFAFRTLTISPLNTSTSIEFIRNIPGDIFKRNTNNHRFEAVSAGTKLTSGTSQKVAAYNFVNVGEKAMTATGITLTTTGATTWDFKGIVAAFSGAESDQVKNIANLFTIRTKNGAESVVARATSTSTGLVFQFATPIKLDKGANPIEVYVTTDLTKDPATGKKVLANGTQVTVPSEVQINATLHGVQYEGTTTPVSDSSVRDRSTTDGMISQDSIAISTSSTTKPTVTVAATDVIKALEWANETIGDITVENRDENTAISPKKMQVTISSIANAEGKTMDFNYSDLCISTDPNATCTALVNTTVTGSVSGTPSDKRSTWTVTFDVSTLFTGTSLPANQSKQLYLISSAGLKDTIVDSANGMNVRVSNFTYDNNVTIPVNRTVKFEK